MPTDTVIDDTRYDLRQCRREAYLAAVALRTAFIHLEGLPVPLDAFLALREIRTRLGLIAGDEHPTPENHDAAL